MEKEWFNGFVANGLQFRLDGRVSSSVFQFLVSKTM